MGNPDNFDPAISDALAVGREIILFDNAGVGRSTGTARTPSPAWRPTPSASSTASA
jgi:hypothetical protein